MKHLVMNMRETYPSSVIMVGNVVTGGITENLILSGAQCLTRRQTGCGKICSGGGITCPGGSYRYEPHIIEKKFKQFYGMSSTLAQETFGNGKPNWAPSDTCCRHTSSSCVSDG